MDERVPCYLWVIFALLVVHTSVILAEHRIAFAEHGLALINALALAKVMLVARDLHFADRFKEAPLIYPTLFKSAASPFSWVVSKFSKKLSWVCITGSLSATALTRLAAAPSREYSP